MHLIPVINLKKYIVHKNDKGHNNESLDKKGRIKEEIIRTDKKNNQQAFHILKNTYEGVQF